MTFALLAGLLSALTLPPQSLPDPCTLISSAEIATALGAKPGPGSKEGPTRDEESKADTSNCTFGAGEKVLVVGLSELGSSQAAAAAVAEAEKVSTDDDDAGLRLAPQTGVGDRSLWGFNEVGATWVAQKGKYMLSVTVGGEVGDAGKLRDPLKRLVVSALAKL